MRTFVLASLGVAALAAAPLALSSADARAQTTGPAPAAAPAAKGAKAAKGAAPAEAAKPDPAAAERAMESGIKSYEAGKNEVATQALTTAMQGGALPGPKMARALYYRGLAYKKLGKPAQSISDLTSALWLKGGLTEAERADALAQRETAYKEAGIAQAPAVTTAAGKATAPATTATAAAATAPAAGAQKAADKPTETASTSSGGGFFSNLFGSGSSATPPAPAAAGASTATGSVSPPPEPAASSWSSATNASTGAKPTTGVAAAAAAAPAPKAAPATKVAAAAPAAAAAAPAASVAEGKFRLQVAAVRTRAEADTISARLKKDFAKKIGGREPVIDEAVIGNMGTFYRVRVGPYASANEPRQLCITLRASGGFDCLVVTQ